MDFFTIASVMCFFAFFVFLWVLFFYLRNKELEERLWLLLVSSFTMFISLTAFYFEFKLMVIESDFAFIFSFISASMLFVSIFAITKMISNLYHEEMNIKLSFVISYSTFVGILFAINTVFGSYFYSFVLMMIVLIPLGYEFSKALLKSKENLKHSPFIYQLALLGMFYVLKMINLVGNRTISPLHPDVNDNIYTMFSLIILIMFNITYLLEYNQILNSKLQSKSQSLSQSLHIVKKESETDTLTRIPNRAKLNCMLEAYYNTYQDYGTEFLVAMIDLNNFKKVNDRYGHSTGDELLREIASNLEKVVRINDIVGRWGGDEFLIIFPNTTIDVINKIKENIVFGFNLLKLPIDSVNVSLSIGIASSSECANYKELLHLADSRMYKQKNRIIEKIPLNTN